MLKLHGLVISNYYNIVKLALLEKGFDFEEVRAAPSQEEQFLSMSPMGKIPVLEAREGFLSETSAILEFLEEINHEIPLLPEDHYARSKVRELMKVFELYVDLAIRPHIGAVFGWHELDEARVPGSKALLEQGLAAVERMTSFEPYLLGSEFGAADIYGYYILDLAQVVAQQLFEQDIYSSMPGLTQWRDKIAARPLTRKVDAVAAEARSKLVRV